MGGASGCLSGFAGRAGDRVAASAGPVMGQASAWRSLTRAVLRCPSRETVGVMEYIILIVVLAVLLIGGVGSTFLLRPRSRRRTGRGGAGEVTPTAPERTGSETAGESGGGTGTMTAPGPVAPAGQAAPAKPYLEKPPPSAGRMVRLRARLARSQTGFGAVLLTLLSRDRLDDDTWDEIEEALITADVGVAACPPDRGGPADQGEGGGHPDAR